MQYIVRNIIMLIGYGILGISLYRLYYKPITPKDGKNVLSTKTTGNVTEIYIKISGPNEAHKVRENICSNGESRKGGSAFSREYEAECKMWEDIVRKYCR